MSYPWFTHAFLQRSVKVGVSIINEGPLRIGAGKAPPLKAVDLPVITTKLSGIDTAYIPGSSLKGVIRATCELIAKSSGIPNICEAGNCGNKYLDELEELTYHKALDKALRENDVEEVKRILDLYCLVCKTFGSSSFGSHVDFQDAYPQGRVSLGVKTGIAINRRSGAVRRGAFYEVEYVEPGHEFRGSITIRNLPNYLIGLVFLALDYLDAGVVRVGGFKSRGFGKVAVKVTGMNGYVLDQSEGTFKSLNDVRILRKLDKFDDDVEIDLANLPKTSKNFKQRWFEYVDAIRASRPS